MIPETLVEPTGFRLPNLLYISQNAKISQVIFLIRKVKTSAARLLCVQKNAMKIYTAITNPENPQHEGAKRRQRLLRFPLPQLRLYVPFSVTNLSSKSAGCQNSPSRPCA